MPPIRTVGAPGQDRAADVRDRRRAGAAWGRRACLRRGRRGAWARLSPTSDDGCNRAAVDRPGGAGHHRAARSEQRKTTTLAISSSVAMRPSGILAACAASDSSLVKPARLGRSGRPGRPRRPTARRTPPPGRDGVDEHALRRRRCRRTRARARPARPWSRSRRRWSATAACPPTRSTLTIRPQPRSAIAGAKARMSRIEAITCSSHWACQSSSVSSSSERAKLVPALLTRMSGARRRAASSDPLRPRRAPSRRSRPSARRPAPSRPPPPACARSPRRCRGSRR